MLTLQVLRQEGKDELAAEAAEVLKQVLPS